MLEGGAPRTLNLPTRGYRTTDGWIMVALVKEERFACLVTALGRPDLAADRRLLDFAARARLASVLGEIFPIETTAGWLARLRLPETA